MSLRIAITGLAGMYPFGGMFWHYLQYLLGLRRLGHDVLYIEDTGKWCYDPSVETFVENGEKNAAFLARELSALDSDLSDRWFFRDAAGKSYGRSWQEVESFCRSADLLLHISASNWMRREEDFTTTAKIALVDTDPLYTQASLMVGATDKVKARVARWQKHHDVFFSFGENIGAADCLIPTGPFQWMPTRQPVVLDCFEQFAVPVAARRQVLTTVASWEPNEQGPLVDGIAYSGKSREFEKFIDLPFSSPLPLEVALSGPAPIEQLRSHGWIVRDGYEVSPDPWVYRDYLAHSGGEWSIAKNAYVVSRSGWFSCRTACYLALGVPAILQDTGFSHIIPTGEGLLTFTTPAEAIAAIDRLKSNPQRHAKAAREIAQEYFDSDKVLTSLIERAGSREQGRTRGQGDKGTRRQGSN